MTHIGLPEIGAKNRYQKTGTINWHKNKALSYSLPESGTGKIRHQTACQTLQKPASFFGYQFSAPISGTCVVGIVMDD